MNSIFDPVFLHKIFNRKIRRGIVWVSYDLDWLALNKKIDFACETLYKYKFNEAHFFIYYWEKDEIIVNMLNKWNITNYRVLKKYKGKIRGGLIEIIFMNSFIKGWIKEIITCHYGYEMAKENSLSMVPYVVMVTDNCVHAIKLYDDRGFYEYIIPKS